MAPAFPTFLRRLALASSVLLAGCASIAPLGPARVEIADLWQATLPHGGRASGLLSWWSSFDDAALTALIGRAQAENPSLDSAAAEIARARATLASARAGLLPSLAGSASATQSGTGGDAANRIATAGTGSGGLDASWEVDLFGKNRRTAEAARLRVRQEVANWHEARVSLAAEVADDYVQYRACRQIESTYRAELASQAETIRATETASTSGLTSPADLSLARASAAASASALTAQRAECEVLVKSLAQLTGGDEPRVRRVLAPGRGRLPEPRRLRIDAVPADALRQRPDIGTLELDLAATVADFGAAKADLYPSLSLSGAVTLSGSTLIGASAPWSFGPALSVPLFDGGSRLASVARARADYDSAVAAYRSGVLGAVAEVETALVRLEAARRRIGDLDSAARNYRAYFRSIDANWRAGGSSLLDREEARRSALAADLSLIEVRRDAVRYWIALYKALGGGWSGDPLAPAPAVAQPQGRA